MFFYPLFLTLFSFNLFLPDNSDMQICGCADRMICW